MKHSSYPSRCSAQIIDDGTPPFRKQFHSDPWRRKRPRKITAIASWHIFAMAVLALATSLDTPLVVLASDTKVLRISNNNDDSYEGEKTRKPYRPMYGGRLKLVPTRKLVRVTTTTIDNQNTTPWVKKDVRGDKVEQAERGVERFVQDPTPTLWQKFSPFLKRGILLAALTAVAVIDKQPPSAALLPAGTVASNSWFPFLRLDWKKLWGLPGEILPSLSAALMIAWIPNLFLQKAYFELAFLVASLTSQPILRNYLLAEVLPSLGGTVRKLFWSEFWKQAWDYLLEPFPKNLLIPTRISSSQRQNNENVSKWQAEIARFWSDRVVSRIDKWTASSIKALLQKNVQSSVHGLAEDTWKAAAYAYYPDWNRQQQLEDTRRMIELECEDGVKNCQDNKTSEEPEASRKEEEEELQEINADANAVQESSPSSTVEVQEVSSFSDDIEEPEAIFS